MTTVRSLTALHIGTDRHFLRACVRRDVGTVAICGAAAWDVGVRLPDPVRVLRVDDQQNPEQLLAALYRAGMAEHRFDAVYTTDEWSLVTAGLLAHMLGARGIDPRVAVNFRDKWLQKRVVRQAGVPAARSHLIPDIRHLDGVDPAALGLGRAVLKPASGAGTALTSIIDNVDDLSAASARLQSARGSPRGFVLEEFVEGEEWVADGVVFDGEVVFNALGRYGDPCLTTIARQAPLVVRRFDPETEAWAYQRGDPVIRAALAALGLHSGVFHMELFHDPSTGTVTFGECAARRGGGFTHEEVLCKFNVDLGECALACALGERPEPEVRIRPGMVGCGQLVIRPGTVMSYPSRAELLALPNVQFARMDRPFGAPLPARITDTTQRVGQVLVTADTEAELFERISEVQNWFDERMVVAPTGVTMRELRAWHQSHWPDSDFGDILYG